MKLYREIKLLTEDGEVTDVILTDQVYTEDHIKAMLKNRSVCDGGASRVSLNGMVCNQQDGRYLIPQVTEDELEEVVTKTFKLKKETEEK